MDDINEATAVPPGNGDAWLVIVTLVCLFLWGAHVAWRERHQDRGCGVNPLRLVPVPDPRFQR